MACRHPNFCMSFVSFPRRIAPKNGRSLVDVLAARYVLPMCSEEGRRRSLVPSEQVVPSTNVDDHLATLQAKITAHADAGAQTSLTPTPIAASRASTPLAQEYSVDPSHLASSHVMTPRSGSPPLPPRAIHAPVDTAVETVPQSAATYAAHHDRVALERAELQRDLQELALLMDALRSIVPVPDTADPTGATAHRRSSSFRHPPNPSRPVIVHVVNACDDVPVPYPKPLRPHPTAPVSPVRRSVRASSVMRSADSRAYTSFMSSTPNVRRSSSIAEELSVSDSADLGRRY
jgi:hypothetical protein